MMQKYQNSLASDSREFIFSKNIIRHLRIPDSYDAKIPKQSSF